MSNASKPAWIDLATDDVTGTGEFYSQLFGWDVHVSDDPQYGGYAMAHLEGGEVGGIGPKQDPNQPSAWSFYVHTDDADQLAARVREAGGTVIAEPFDVGDQGRMAVFQDPSGAFFSAWQPGQMDSFTSGAPGALVWAELSARGVESVIPFYTDVFGWETEATGSASGAYTRLKAGGQAFGGAVEMSPMVPTEVPNHWLVYFGSTDVDASHRRAVELGGRELLEPTDSPGGRFSIVADPNGAAFGIVQAG